MNEKKKYTGVELMESAPVGTAIIRLAIPMMIAMLAQAIFSVTDIFFIGQTHNPNMVAAVSLAFPLYMVAQAVGNIFATGGSSYISRMLGAQKQGEALHASSVSFYTAIGVGIVFTAVLLVFKAPIIWMIGASEATFGYTDDYFSAVALAMPFATAGGVMSGLMRSEGETKKAMKLQLIGICINIVLDPIFILWAGWGTAGAGWATVVAQVASFIYGIRYFVVEKTNLSIKPADYVPNKTMMSQILLIGIPAGLSFLIMSFANVLVNRIAADYGDHVVAGYGVQMRVGSLLFMVVFALVMGFQPFAGFNYGAKKYDRLREGFRLTAIYSTGLCIVGVVILRLFGARMIGFFINDPQTIEAGAAILNAFIWGILPMGIQVTIMISFQALGKPVQALLVNMGRQLILFVPMLLLMNHFFGFTGFIWAQPAADILTTGIAAVLGISLRRILSGKEEHAE